MKITVNQTKNLVNQAVSITWAGGRPTIDSASRFPGNYLQIMQCWGDDDGTVAANPGPPPEQCVQGATSAVYGGIGGTLFPSISLATERIVSRKNWPGFNPSDGTLDTRTGNVWKPFRAVKGEVIGIHKDPTFNPQLSGGDFWLNPYFNIVTTNEVAGARTGVNGTGAELFEVNTGEESSGLGCGQKVQPMAGGGTKVPQCWIVVVPRGTPKEENVGTPFQDNADQVGVVTSPLTASAWANRIAVPLQFNPLDSPCQLSDDQRRLVGTELAVSAVSSWQPKLCSAPGRPPYAYGTVSDKSARLQLASRAAGAPGMVLVSRPLDPSTVSPDNPVTYAPVTLSATVVGFNVERVPTLDADAPEQSLSGVRVADINLTPRLLAKLLTQSYTEEVAVGGTTPPSYAWTKSNPKHMGADPDFVQFNPEFAALTIRFQKNFGGLLAPNGSSDFARQVWEYVLADPEAKAWLDGQPDPWGMKVNPAFATKASANSTGAAFADPPPDTFPKSDPYCFQAPPQSPGGAVTVVPPPLCGTDWLPYTGSLRDAARFTRAANDGARIVNNPVAISPDQVYKADVPETLGSRAMLALTDSASAAQYGLQQARLSRAGDDGANRRFVAADAASLTEGVASMKAKAEPAMLEPNPTAAAPAAYPLTALTYAVITPLAVDAKARDDYAAFVDYAAGPGQVSGPELGQLPKGYAPLPASLRAQATASAKTIRALPAAAPTVTSVPTTGAPPGRSSTVPPSTAPRTGTSTGPASASGLSSSSGGASETPLPVTTTTAARSETTKPGGSPPAANVLLTPGINVVHSHFVPGLAGLALLSAWGALEITKRPRSRQAGGEPPPPHSRSGPNGGG